MTGPVVAVLGAGNMAGAIARALHRAQTATLVVTTESSQPDWTMTLAGVTHRRVADHPDANREAVVSADVVVLGVKPAGITALAEHIRDTLSPDALVVSVAAGVVLKDLRTALGGHRAVARAMPNTPVAIGRGVTAVSVADDAPAGLIDSVRDLLEPTGTVVAIAEQDIDAFSAVIGSGPAYVYRMVEAFEHAAAGLGLAPDLASRAVRSMVAGSAEYLIADGREPAVLREEVTSPAGSTAQALAVFEEAGLDDLVATATRAAARRAAELGSPGLS